MERYCSHVTKIIRFGTSHKVVFLVFGVSNVPNIWHLAHLTYLLWMLLPEPKQVIRLRLWLVQCKIFSGK